MGHMKEGKIEMKEICLSLGLVDFFSNFVRDDFLPVDFAASNR